ncbi:hypothetical protein PENTCL1PPCAC_13261, partial [Pristionchus entomophagus]
MEAKEEPIDDFPLMPAGNEADNKSVLKEPKEEPLELVMFENEEKRTSPSGAPPSSTFTGVSTFTSVPREVKKEEENYELQIQKRTPPGVPLSSTFTGISTFTCVPREGEVKKEMDSECGAENPKA